MKPKLIVSACLLGENCKYNGSNNYNKDVVELQKYFDLVPICPETFGMLPTPRVPSEIRDGKVYSKDGKDVTKEFVAGANQAMYIANECNCGIALLKERSPSCGYGVVYDGTFTGNLVEGNGITADLFNKRGIDIFGESKISKLIQLYGE